MAVILLIGNGPNRLKGGASWQNVVRLAANHVRLANAVEAVINEPLPLVYEVIASTHPGKERETKTVLADRMRGLLEPNSAHRQVMALGWETVLTTNYDYCLEDASGDGFVSDNMKRENTYSLFRRRSFGTRSVWHIHGELDKPHTMMLGLRQYAGSLQKMRHYLTAKESPFTARGSRWVARDGPHSWADLFLRDDVHIVGFTFDYAETHLWWLLSWKQRLRHRRPLGKLRVGGTTFYQFGKEPQRDQRLRLMMALEVKVVPVPTVTEYAGEQDWERLMEMLRKVKTS